MMNNDIQSPSNEIRYINSGDILNDMRSIIDLSNSVAYQFVNEILVRRNWFLGKRIAEEELKGEGRAEYGLKVIKYLSAVLSKQYGKGLDSTNLYRFLKFYKYFPEIVDTVCQQSQKLLSWSHYRILLSVEDSNARFWYEQEAKQQNWSVRTLRRNVETQYYYRLLSSQNKRIVEDEMKNLTAKYQNDKYDYVKNPFIAEFLGLASNADLTETELESAILSNLQKFIMELGKGYAFVARQQRISTDKREYFIDLVFYNYILKCFVLIDLKTGKVTRQDVGQMDMYIRMYDELERSEGDNPTLGIILCSETDEDIARYSVMHGSEQLFATKYKLYLPSEEELRIEIEKQKTIYYIQHKMSDTDD